MCAIRCRLTDLCQQIAQLEYELEQELCGSKPVVKEYALGMIRRRGDTRAEQILLSYMGPPQPETPPLIDPMYSLLEKRFR